MDLQGFIKTSSERHKSFISALSNKDQTRLYSMLDKYFHRNDVSPKIIHGKVCVDCDYGAEGIWGCGGDDNISVELSHDITMALFNWNNWLDYMVDIFWPSDEYKKTAQFIDKEWKLFQCTQKRLAIELKREAHVLRVFYYHGKWLGYKDEKYVEITINENNEIIEQYTNATLFESYGAYISRI